MASILRNPRVLLVFCMTACISAAAPSSSDQEHHGRIRMRVEIQNRTYSTPSSPGQQYNSRAVPSVNPYRAVDYSSPTAYNRPYQSGRTLNGQTQTYHANPRSVPADSRRYTGEARPAANSGYYTRDGSYNRPTQTYRSYPNTNPADSRSYVADRSYNRPSETYHSNHRTDPADSRRYIGESRPAANSGHHARDGSYNRPTQTYRSYPNTNPADSRRYNEGARPAARSTPYVPDASYNRPSEAHLSNHRTDSADSRSSTGEARPESYARSSQPEISSPRPAQTHTGDRNGARVNQQRRHEARTDNNDRASVGGSRYGIRRRIYYNNPLENEQTEREREIREPLPRPRVAHTSHSNANQGNQGRKKWIHCHHDGIAFVSQEADPAVLGI